MTISVLKSLRRKTSHAQLVDQKLNSFSAKSFGEDVRQLILRIDQIKFDHQISEESYLPNCCGHIEKHQLLQGLTASSTIPVIYIQQFWDTVCFNSSTGLYSCQLDEQWFNLHKDILIDALDITLTNDNNPFVALPSSDTVIEYVNNLGYLSTLRNVSVMSVNALYQPWRAILTMINICLTGKTAGFDRPRHHVLQILKNLATASRGKKKTTHLIIPSIRYVGKDGREIFVMPIPDALLTDEIKGAPYYGEYQEHVTKYQQHLDSEHGNAAEEGATESFKATKVTKPKAAKATKPASDPKPKPVPTQPPKAVPKKKQKLVQETPDEPSPSKRSKDVSVEEPSYNEEEANLQRALKLHLKEQAEHTHRSARLVVIREPDSGRIQQLSETLKNKSLVDQFIFHRRTSMPVKASGPVESPSLDAKLALTDSETESDDEVPKINTRDQDEGHARPNPGSQPQLSHVVHAGPNLELMDLEATNASHLQNPEQLDEELTITAYPNVQENLKLPFEDPVISKEPASSTGTLSSMQNLEKELSFTDQFFVEKLQEEEPGKTNAEAEVQSMVSVPIQQDTSSVPPMTTPVIDLMTSQSSSSLPISLATTSTVMTTTTILPPPPQPQQSTANPTESQHPSPDQLLSYLKEARRKKRKRRDVPRTPFGSPPPRPLAPPPPACVSGAQGTSGASRSSRFPPPPPPPSTSTFGSTQQQGSKAPSLSKTQKLSPTDSLIPDDSILDEQVYLFDDEDFKNDHLPTADSRKGWWNQLPAEERPATPKPTWAISSSNLSNVENNWATALASTYVTLAENLLLVKNGDMTKGSSLALSISKMKAASYPGFGLELLVPEQIHDSLSRRKEVKSYMRILNVVRIKAYSRYGYDYLSEIVLRRADL
uniref:Monodehydroascorbate reductase n=1 Tax=Tanacetum cinerariifolium TaxID=118510 RepID=A0A6L2L984_TANCI|nr:hypothetical protein [Tanacetum cinerariifolium]